MFCRLDQNTRSTLSCAIQAGYLKHTTDLLGQSYESRTYQFWSLLYTSIENLTERVDWTIPFGSETLIGRGQRSPEHDPVIDCGQISTFGLYRSEAELVGINRARSISYFMKIVQNLPLIKLRILPNSFPTGKFEISKKSLKK